MPLIGNSATVKKGTESAFWVLLIILVVTLLQVAIPYPLDDDTAYHFSVARLIREQGALHSFPWTRFSWQLDHYADKEFLFHALFIPFTPLGFNAATRIVGIISGSVLLSAMYLVLRAEKVRYAGMWSLLPLGTTIFLYRFLQVRPHLFSIAFAIVFIWALCRQKGCILFLVALLYPLFYVAFWQIPLILSVATAGGIFLSGRSLDGKFLLLVVAGIVAGILIGIALHPNSINLLEMNRIHMVDVLFRNSWGDHVEFNMGGEVDPLGVDNWFRVLLLPTTLAIYGVVHAWLERKNDPLYPALALAMVVFAILTVRSNRFLEYFVPFSVLTFALITERRGKQYFLFVSMVFSIAFTFFGGGYLLDYIYRQSERSWQMSPQVIEKAAGLIPVGSNVFTCGWEYTGELLEELPGRNYMVAVDPTMLYKQDAALYTLWYRTLLDAPSSSAQIVRRQFFSRFVICLDHPSLHPFFNALAADVNANVLYSDGKWVMFDLGNGLQDKP